MTSPSSLNTHTDFPGDVRCLRGRIRQYEPMSKHTTWRVGGPAEWFYEPADIEDVAVLLQHLPVDVPLLWIGLGSNLLVRDGGIPGVIVLTAGLLNTLHQTDDTTLYAEAGVSCAKIARVAARAGLTGAEFLSGIPGTLGGALTMNAGAFGGETWQLVDQVEVLTRHGQRHHRTASDYDIGYRHLKGPANEWFIAAMLRLTADPQAVTAGSTRIKALLAKRNATQPIGQPSCGSVFRNPTGHHAARLIEQSGWKGKAVGGARVSDKHANFIINEGQATATDIETLMHAIQASVKAAFGVQLIPEVKMVGEKEAIF